MLPKTYSRVAAVLCIALWAILTVWSIGLFNRARTSFLPIKPTTTLVVHGPYQFTRNPMYFGLVCLYLGLALWFGMFWALILLPAVIALVQHHVIAREEQYLERKFGEEYLRYKADGDGGFDRCVTPAHNLALQYTARGKRARCAL